MDIIVTRMSQFIQTSLVVRLRSKRGDGVITMGVVGFVNGMARPGTGYVAAVYDDCKLTGFTVIGAEQ
ncbi:hypothetical protein KGT21_002529 [Salmonella enterica]|nr:hypothetical protein [Salmonella enterica]